MRVSSEASGFQCQIKLQQPSNGRFFPTSGIIKTERSRNAKRGDEAKPGGSKLQSQGKRHQTRLRRNIGD